MTVKAKRKSTDTINVKTEPQSSVHVTGSITINDNKTHSDMILIAKKDLKAIKEVKDIFLKQIIPLRKFAEEQIRINEYLKESLRVAEAKLNDIEKFGKIKPPVYGRSIK